MNTKKKLLPTPKRRDPEDIFEHTSVVIFKLLMFLLLFYISIEENLERIRQYK